MNTNILKIYISHFLCGLTFWWGIEKLFMRQLGIDPAGMALISAIFIGSIVLFDIPAGILADRWSRRGVLMVSAVFLAVSCVVLGLSTGFVTYLVGAVLYAFYFVCSNGTYQAIIYDTLHESGESASYGRVIGLTYAMIGIGAGIADAMSGYIASAWGFRLDYFLTAGVALVNLGLLASLHEPAYHRLEAKERVIKALGVTLRNLFRVPLLRSLLVLTLAIGAYNVFKEDLSQLYMLLYVSTPEGLGWLWSAFAFVYAGGAYVAHRFAGRLNVVVVVSVVPVVLMAIWDSPVSVVWFMVEVFTLAILNVALETRIQHASPSEVRASVMSVISVLTRAISIPVVLVLGGLAKAYGPFVMVEVLAIVMSVVGLYWWTVGRRRLALANLG